ncbi:MAG: glycosyltransferase family 2 protein [bacterium]|nr:glycosyltransferase family 2 protein [bacterium]
MPPLTIIIPALNEESAIARVIADIKEKCAAVVHEIIVVDDGSTDRTAQVAQQAGARVLRHYRNIGYGAALKTGIRQAQTEYIVTMDADGQHRASDVNRLWEQASSCDMVVGQRVGFHNSPLWRMPGKRLLRLMANYITRYHIPDLNSGLRVLRRTVVLQYLHLCPSGFSFSTTITVAMLSQGRSVVYVPIQVERRVGKSTVTVTTGLDTIILILRIAALFEPLRVFVPASVLIGTTGVLWEIPIALAGLGVSVGSMLAIVTAILLFGLGLICDQISQLRLERLREGQDLNTDVGGKA